MVASPEVVARVVQICRQAAQANRQTAARRGNLIVLSPDVADDVMITTDLHGQRLNFLKLCRIADLAAHPRRHLVLQEVCHGGPRYPSGWGCMSHLLLEDVARLKADHPDRVHFLLSNHELAELTDHPIAKAGRMLNLQFRAGLQELYGDSAQTVRAALVEFLGTCPLGVRLTTGVFVCHGSPSSVDRRGFDTGVFHRPLADEDFRTGGGAFQVVWGRDFRPENAEAFAKLVDSDVLIHGHEPCSRGVRVPNERQIILDCSGRNASYLLLPTKEKLTQGQIVQRVQRLYPKNATKQKAT
jgi:hypothetical protein